MAGLILFALILVLSFGVLIYFLRPTSAEVAVEEHLEGIDAGRAAGAPGTIVRAQKFSSNPWLEEVLRDFPGSQWLSRLIRQAGRKWQVGNVLLLSLLTVFVGWGLASLVIQNILLSAGVGVVLGVTPYLYLYIVRAVRFRQFGNLLPEAVDLMARGLRAGHAVTAVLEMVGREIAEPVASEFRTLHEEQTLGLSMRDAMLNLVDRVPLDDVRFLTTAVLLQKETGGNLAVILDKTAAVMRERARLRGQLRIYTAQGRITGWILCLMPFVMFAVLSLVNKKYESILFTDVTGQHLLYYGLVSMIIGILVIRKIIDVKV
jgi:tight adherence protein B